MLCIMVQKIICSLNLHQLVGYPFPTKIQLSMFVSPSHSGADSMKAWFMPTISKPISWKGNRFWFAHGIESIALTMSTNQM